MRSRKVQLVACSMVALVAIAKFVSSPDAPDEKKWAGQYRNDTVSIEIIDGDDETFTGTIRMGEQRFSFQARLEDDQLQGTFQSDGTDFSFTATLNGNELMLLTDGATLALTRSPTTPPPSTPPPVEMVQAPPPPNPLLAPSAEPPPPAEPVKAAPTPMPEPREKVATVETPAKPEPKKPPVSPPGRAQAPPRGNTAGPATIVLNKTEIFDPMIGCNAATILVPKGWKMEGGVGWRQHPFYPAFANWRFFDPASDAATAVYPMLLFNDGIREAAMQTAKIAGPEAVQFVQQAYPEGGSYMGAEVRRRVHTPVDYVMQFIIPRYRQDLAGARPVSVQDMPVYAKAKMTEYGYDQLPGSEMKASRIRFAYQVNGRNVEEDFVCVLGAAPMNNMVSWGGECSSYRAAKGKLDGTMPIFRVMDRSLKLDMKWFNAQAQVAKMIQENIRQAGRQAVELSRYISQVNNEISDIITKSYEERQRTMDRVHDNFDHMIRGTETYQSPFQNHPVEVPSDYDRVFQNPLGEIILTNDVTFDPGTVSNQDWRELHKNR